MSPRYYQDLHDRELIAQALTMLREVERRKLIDIFLPDDLVQQSIHADVFPRRPASIGNENGRLVIHLERSFFRHS